MALIPLLFLFASQPEIVMDLRDWPLKISSEAQLFVDDYLIAKRENATLKVHQPQRHPSNPLLLPSDYENTILAYGSVLREDGRFRMWYTNHIGIAYAESRDGIKWEKPPVGIEIDGRKTNTLMRGHRGRSDTLTIFRNPSPDPVHEYLAYAMEYRFPDKDGVRENRREGIYLQTSADGLRWTEREEPVMYSIWRNKEDRPGNTTAELGDVHHISWDPKLKKFIGHIKVTIDEVRMRGFTESEDGIHWSQPRLLLRPDEQDRPGDQLYSLIGFPYESVWIGYLGLFHKTTDDKLDIQLAVSHDGRYWTRPLRQPFMPTSAAWDSGVIHMAANPPLRVGDKLYFYYGGYGPNHSVRASKAKQAGIGLATLRPDGFVSVHAEASPARVITRPLTFSGSRLHLNADIRPGGELRVTVLDRKYQPISGLVSQPLTGDSLDMPVKWSGTLKGQDVRLQFDLKNADLYSFRID